MIGSVVLEIINNINSRFYFYIILCEYGILFLFYSDIKVFLVSLLYIF